jgi:hypothetical protein
MVISTTLSSLVAGIAVWPPSNDRVCLQPGAGQAGLLICHAL